MDFLTTVVQWFAGGADHPYHTLYHCMAKDSLWVGLTITFDFMVAAGYGVIAYHWWKNQRNAPNTPAKDALRYMRNIFILCCVCGYVFIPIKMVWPAWRLYDIVIGFLIYYTWRYALSSTGLKVIYNELGQSQKLKQDLEQSQRESRQKSLFLNALSHDLRTPLNAVILNAHVARLSAESNDPESMNAAMKEIECGAKAAADLLNSLLQCARLDWVEDPVQVTTFPLHGLMSTAMSIAGTQGMDKGIELHVECPPALQITTDKVKLERILGNLVTNAVKFTDRGSVQLTAQSSVRNLEIYVTDTGPGVSPEHQSLVFDEFYQVNNHERDRSKGFGLGLAIARRLARQIGGDIELHSAVGHGSRFSVLLPGVVAAAPVAAVRTAPAIAVAVGG